MFFFSCIDETSVYKNFHCDIFQEHFCTPQSDFEHFTTLILSVQNTFMCLYNGFLSGSCITLDTSDKITVNAVCSEQTGRPDRHGGTTGKMERCDLELYK